MSPIAIRSSPENPGNGITEFICFPVSWSIRFTVLLTPAINEELDAVIIRGGEGVGLGAGAGLGATVSTVMEIVLEAVLLLPTVVISVVIKSAEDSLRVKVKVAPSATPTTLPVKCAHAGNDSAKARLMKNICFILPM